MTSPLPKLKIVTALKVDQRLCVADTNGTLDTAWDKEYYEKDSVDNNRKALVERLKEIRDKLENKQYMSTYYPEELDEIISELERKE